MTQSTSTDPLLDRLTDLDRKILNEVVKIEIRYKHQSRTTQLDKEIVQDIVKQFHHLIPDSKGE